MREIDVNELEGLLAGGSISLIDVRGVDEWQTGHVPGAELIVMSTIPGRVQDLPHGEEIFIICESGGRSFQVGTWLEGQGFQAVNIAGGTGAWRDSGKPLAF